MKRFLNLVFLQIGSDDTDTSGKVFSSLTNLSFFRYQIEFNPASIRQSYDTLGTKNGSVGVRLCKCLEDGVDLRAVILMNGFRAPAT